jgi:hypothetical protein
MAINGYGIPCINHLIGGEKLAVIISHGFGNSKESPRVRRILGRTAEARYRQKTV